MTTEVKGKIDSFFGGISEGLRTVTGNKMNFSDLQILADFSEKHLFMHNRLEMLGKEIGELPDGELQEVNSYIARKLEQITI